MSERLQITRLGGRGEGIADGANGRVRVPFALPGETVTAEVAGETGFLETVLTPSPDRSEPFCRHFTRCGGCATQHMGRPAYAAWKRGLVANALERAGLPVEAQPLLDAGGVGRRRVTLHVRFAGKGAAARAQAGFMRARSHDLIDLDSCPILVPALAAAPDIARAIGGLLIGRGKPLDVQVTATATGLDVDIRGSGPPTPAERLDLTSLAAAHDLARLTVHGDLIVERRSPVLPMGKARLVPPPGGFLQATAAGEAALSAEVLAGLDGARNVADLFCGTGPFALRLAGRAAVTAFDSAADAISALQRAAATTQGLRPIKAATRDLFRRPLTAKELAGFDGVVLDPPRAGAETQARELARSAVPRIVSVSCDVSSFVRDAGLLAAGGYRLTRLVPVDQFVHSAHLELVGTFVR